MIIRKNKYFQHYIKNTIRLPQHHFVLTKKYFKVIKMALYLYLISEYKIVFRIWQIIQNLIQF